MPERPRGSRSRPATRERTRLALAKLPEVHPIHDVAAWARRCGLSPFQLREALRVELDLTPTEVYLCFVASQWEQAQRDGRTQAEVAGTLGYADPSAFAHAIQRGRELQAVSRRSPWPTFA